MLRFSAPYSPQMLRRGDVFAARQYPRQAFDNLIDPVLNIDWFEMKGPTFPAHPHAGFSAVTYVFTDSPSGFLNRDSLGGVHDILPGGLHWSRASSGMIHEETPLPGGGAVRGLQIFVNLPAANQADGAAAFPLSAAEVVENSGQGWRSRTAINGTAIGQATNALPAPIRLQEIAFDRDAAFTVDLPEGWGGILIALEGDVHVGGRHEVAMPQAIGFAADEAGSFTVRTLSAGARVALVAGIQLRQPVHAFGPLMLASPEALDAARTHVATLSIPPLETL
jgi:redox-sensitive bicupin YhaK (pirin superfamily)